MEKWSENGKEKERDRGLVHNVTNEKIRVGARDE